MNGVLLILRLALALYLVAGATAKLSGRSRREAAVGPELAAGAVELGAGALLALGLFMPLAGLLLVAVTANLAFVSWPHEYPLYMLFAAVAIALAGPGGYSLDQALLGSSVGGPGSLGVAAALAGAVAMEGRRRLHRHSSLLAPWSRRQIENVREEPGNAG
jgi:putative oxidoreductase